MSTYISMLRGINVSGHNMIKMAELTSLYQSLGFENVVTYLQSGNVIFKSGMKDSKILSVMIEAKIKEKFKYNVPVLIRTPDEIKQVLSKNPFLKKAEPERLYITFLADNPGGEIFEEKKIHKKGTDEFYILGKEIYLHCPGGYGNTKLSNNFFEKKLNLTATTRNWKTVNMLYELSIK